MSRLLTEEVLVLLAQPTLAGDIRGFVAPLAAVIIGVIGLKYLFGDQRSIAGFFGFLVLGIAVFTLIKWGEGLLAALGGVFRSWVVESEVPWSTIIFAAASVVALAAILVGVMSLRRNGQAAEVHEDQQSTSTAMPETDAPSREQCTSDALKALAEFSPRDLSAVDRLQNQVRLAVIVAAQRGVFDPGSPVTPAHLAKWVVLRDMWPEIVDELARQPDLLLSLENEPLTEFTRGEALFHLLRVEPPLHPVVRQLLQMAPVVEG